MSKMESDENWKLQDDELDMGGLDDFKLGEWIDFPSSADENAQAGADRTSGKETQGVGPVPKAYTAAAGENTIDKRKNKVKKSRSLIKAAVIAAAVIVVVYLAGLIYFGSHFLPNTYVDNLKCSGMTAEAAEKALIEEVDKYSLELKEYNDVSEFIYGNDIDISADINGKAAPVLKKQKSGIWFVYLFKRSDYFLQASIKYDEAKLESAIKALDASDTSKMVEPEDAHVAYDEKKDDYYIDEGISGSIIIEDVFLSKVKEAVESLKDTVDLAEEGCYKRQEITADDENLEKELELVKTYGNIKLELVFGEEKEELGIQDIYQWLSAGENDKLAVDSAAVTEYVNTLAEKYNTVDKDRTLHTSWDFDITVEKGDYGWEMDVEATVSKIVEAITAGGEQNVEPEWESTANAFGTTDWGDTYIEVNLTKQHLYYYKEGELIQESDFVSGTVSKARSTPTGIYSIKYKKSPAVLRGINWETPVTYWLPFFDGCGLHDATWRNKFGGTIYYYNGSHGCLNMPLGAVRNIYEKIVAGTPVLIYKTEIEPVEVVPVYETPWPEGYPTAVPTEAPDETEIPVEVVETTAPTSAPTAAPTPAPTAAPTPAPTAAPTEIPPTEPPVSEETTIN